MAGATMEFANPVIGTSVPAPPYLCEIVVDVQRGQQRAQAMSVMETIV